MTDNIRRLNYITPEISDQVCKYAAKYLKEKPKSDDEALNEAVESLNRAYDLGGENDDV